MSANDLDAVPEFVRVHSGPTDRLVRRLLPHGARHRARMLLLVAVTWLPLLILASMSCHVAGYGVSVSFLRDPEVNCRLLIALPLLELAEFILSYSLTVQVKELIRTGIVLKQQRNQFDSIQLQIRQLHETPSAEIALWIISFCLTLSIRLAVIPDITSSWERSPGGLTPAGWWHLLVSLPILYFFLLRAIWVFGLWSWFLLRVSRLDLQLTPTHPDHAGGLGFLAWGLISFAPIIASFSTVMSAGFAYEIYHRGESLDSLKYHVIVYVILVTIIVHLPLLAFTVKLCRCRFHGLLSFAGLVWKHDRAFDEKWLHQDLSAIKDEQLLGTSDVQSLADIATAYEHVDEMRLIPFDTKAATVLALASVIPMLPLIGTAIPLHDIMAKLGELLV